MVCDFKSYVCLKTKEHLLDPSVGRGTGNYSVMH